MNRRKAISGIVSAGFLGFFGLTTYKVFHPRIQELEAYKALLAELAETIIPTTDTPGAKAALVHEFIINAVKDTLTVPQQNRFIAGLEDVEDYCRSEFSKTFSQCSANERKQMLSHLQSKSVFKYGIINKINNKMIGLPFYTRLRDLTVYGYFTSRVGATQALAYDYIPGSYAACINLNPHQKSWATK